MDKDLYNSEWIETGDSCSQYCRDRGQKIYDFIQLLQLEDDYVVVTERIDLNDYTKEDIENEIYGYYDSFQTVIDMYSRNHAEQIVAECIFENISYQTDRRSDMVSEEEAKFIIKRYIESDGKCFLCSRNAILNHKQIKQN